MRHAFWLRRRRRVLPAPRQSLTSPRTRGLAETADARRYFRRERVGPAPDAMLFFAHLHCSLLGTRYVQISIARYVEISIARCIARCIRRSRSDLHARHHRTASTASRGPTHATMAERPRPAEGRRISRVMIIATHSSSTSRCAFTPRAFTCFCLQLHASFHATLSSSPACLQLHASPVRIQLHAFTSLHQCTLVRSPCSCPVPCQAATPR